MIDRPVVLLTFANQQDDAYLEYLKRESSRLDYTLSTLHDKGAIEVYREESATTESVVGLIERFDERIAVFHYGGHADGATLRLEDRDGNATGLAEMLGRLPNLQLVFINGCASKGQVEQLLKEGVKAVIATAVAIDDEKAVVFAESFYRSLSNGHALRSAFERAVSNMKFVYGGDFDANIVRTGEADVQGDAERMPWGLYINEGADAVLQWELPMQHASVLAHQAAVDAAKLQDFHVNQFIEEVIWGMIDVKPELEALCKTEDDEWDPRAVLLQIIQNFPWPIGTQIRLLVAKDGDMYLPSMERIEQIVSVYVVTSQFLFYTVMSQMWDEKRASNFNAKSYLIDMLYINQKQFGQFDYFKNFIEAVDLLLEANCELHIPAFAQLAKLFHDPQSDLYSAYLYLESLRAAIYHGDTQALEEQVKEKSVQGEDRLSSFLYELSFLIQYDLVSVRDIHVVNHRHLEIKFNHFISRLNVKMGDIAVSQGSTKLKARSYTTLANNASVILTSDLQDPTTFLNLSPFIIDKNAFQDGLTEDRATEQQLYMYAHRVEGDDSDRDYQYYATFHNVYIAQERATDQFTIDGSFSGNQGASPRRSGRPSRRRRRPVGPTAQTKNPYAVLRAQFEKLKEDLTSQ